MIAFPLSTLAAVLTLGVAVAASAAAESEAAAESPTPSRVPPEVRAMLDRPVVLELPGTADVEVRNGLVYRRDGETELRLDVYLPPGLAAGELRPAVVYVHGGPMPPGWDFPPRDWGFYRSHGRMTAASGLVAVVVGHRYPSLAGFATSEGDVAAALAYLRGEAALLHVDRERLAVWVFSGGGLHIARLIRDPEPGVRALVAYYPVLDPDAFGPLAVEPAPPELAARLRPSIAVAEAGATAPPLLLVRAGLDAPAYNTAIDTFVAAALQHGLTLDLLTHPAGHHGFDTRNDDERSRAILRRTLAFLHDHLDR